LGIELSFYSTSARLWAIFHGTYNNDSSYGGLAQLRAVEFFWPKNTRTSVRCIKEALREGSDMQHAVCSSIFTYKRKTTLTQTFP